MDAASGAPFSRMDDPFEHLNAYREATAEYVLSSVLLMLPYGWRLGIERNPKPGTVRLILIAEGISCTGVYALSKATPGLAGRLAFERHCVLDIINVMRTHLGIEPGVN